MCRVDTRGYAKAKICGERTAKERRGQDMTGKAKELNRISERRQEKAEAYFPLLNEKKCRGCGKVIFITPEWAYKRTRGSRLYYFCKYTCMKRYDERISKRAYNTLK